MFCYWLQHSSVCRSWRIASPFRRCVPGSIGKPIFSLMIGPTSFRFFSNRSQAFAPPRQRRDAAEDIDFYQWRTGRRWHSEHQPPVLLTSAQWLKLWKMFKPADYLKRESKRRTGRRIRSMRKLMMVVEPLLSRSTNDVKASGEVLQSR